MNDIINIATKFPFLIPDQDFRVWKGIVNLKSDEIFVTIAMPLYPSLHGFSLICPQAVEQNVWKKISEYEQSQGNFHTSGNLLGLLNYLTNTDGENQRKIKKSSSAKVDYKLYCEVLKELEKLGNDIVMHCAGDLSELVLRVIDPRGVEHRLGLRLPGDYPNSRPFITDVDLPDVAMPELYEAKTLLQLFSVFQSLIDSFQDFWESYDQLKKSTWVIDPEVPRCKNTHCRIVIDENVTMILTLNPLEVNSCPDIKFLGPEIAISPFLNSMERRLKVAGWDEEGSIVDNLLSLLGISEFPQRSVDGDVIAPHGECNICFMLRAADGTLPSRLCNNPKCNSFFHIICLAQWFQAVPTNETSFNLISGDCPCCSEKILCPIKIS